MTKTNQFLALVCCSLALLPRLINPQTPPHPNTATEHTEAFAVIDAWLDSVQAYHHIPALSAGIVIGDNLAWSKGYGTIDLKHTIPASPETIYSICSISKLFTSVSLMQQYEAGKVQLDAPLTTYLPWATLKPPTGDTGPITLRGLLTHSSGLPRESDEPYWTGPDFPFPTEAQIKSTLSSQTALYPAERYFQYSNLGLTLVGETVAAVSGEPYVTYAQTHVLDPLGLTDTRSHMPMDLYGKQLAVAYSAIKRDGTRDLVAPFDTRGITPAAGYTSTVVDLGKFVSWNFRLLRTEKPELLKSSTLREMQRVQFMDPDWKTTWGLGFAIQRKDDHTYIGHGGSCPGYETVFYMRPDDQTAVILLNDSSEPVAPFVPAVFDLLDKRKAYKFKGDLPSGVNLSDYTGHYSRQPWSSESILLPWAGGLAYLTLPTADPANALAFLKPKGNDTFRRVRKDGTEAEEYKFNRDPSGKVINFVVFSNIAKRIAPLATP
jgi:CubicO group peptidase (beta-lactamase class C family)